MTKAIKTYNYKTFAGNLKRNGGGMWSERNGREASPRDLVRVTHIRRGVGSSKM